MKPIPLFIIAVFAVGLGIAQISVHQREATLMTRHIVQADAAGSDTASLQHELADQVHAHMGTDATYTLEGSYNRDVAASQAAANPTTNGQVYAQAQAACASKADSIAQATCVQHYLAAHASPATNPQPATMPEKRAYTTTLTSPSWTNDSAGIAFLAATVAAALGVASLFRRRDHH